MYAPTQIPPPSNWQDFQELCRVLWKYVWEVSDEDIIAYGDNGDKQDGVDIYAIVGGEYYGIQCKSKDQLKEKQITITEIDAEIKKAQSFSPKLSKFIIVTSAPKNVQVDNYALQKNAELHKQGLFGFRLLSWKDVCNLLVEHKPALDFYQNKIKVNYKIQVSFNGKDSITIYPKFLRKHISYKLRKPTSYPDVLATLLQDNKKTFQKLALILDQNTRYSEHWHTIPIRIDNIGDSVLRNIKFELVLEDNKVKNVDHGPGCYSFSNCDGIGFQPKSHSDFVQNDCHIIELHVIPKDNVTEIQAYWDFLAEDFSDKGQLTIYVEPQYIDIEDVIEVEHEEQLKEEEITIEPLKE